MIDQSIILQNLTELGANFSKSISPAQVKLIIKIIDDSGMTEKEFLSKINYMMRAESFPRNIKNAFTATSNTTCKVQGCKLRATISGFAHVIKRCDWHDYIFDNHDKNTISGFEAWKEEKISRIQENSHNYPDNAIALVKKLQWNDVSNPLNFQHWQNS